MCECVCVCVCVCVYIYAWVCWGGGQGERREQMVHFLPQNVTIQNVGCLFLLQVSRGNLQKNSNSRKKVYPLVCLGFDWSYLLDVICKLKLHIDYYYLFILRQKWQWKPHQFILLLLLMLTLFWSVCFQSWLNIPSLSFCLVSVSVSYNKWVVLFSPIRMF